MERLLLIFVFGVFLGGLQGCRHHDHYDDHAQYPPPNYYGNSQPGYYVPQNCVPAQSAGYAPQGVGTWAQPRSNCACP